MYWEVPRPTSFVVKKCVLFEITVFSLTYIPFPIRSSTWRRCNSGWRSSTAWTWRRRTRRSPTTIPSSPNGFWPSPSRWTRWRTPTRNCRGRTCTRTPTAITQRLEKKKKNTGRVRNKSFNLSRRFLLYGGRGLSAEDLKIGRKLD